MIFPPRNALGRILQVIKCNSTVGFQSNRSASQLIVKEDQGVLRVTMDSVKTRNSLSMDMMNSLLDVFQTNSTTLRCIVLAANGPVFSSGHNLKELVGQNAQFYKDTFTKASDLMLSIVECPVPVIGVVNGVAAAAGCQLAATCDIVIATEKSSFSTPGSSFGIFCSTPGIAVSRSAGRKAAARMLLTGVSVPAKEAREMGLISVVCAETELDEEVEHHIGMIKSKSKSVIELGKKFFYQQVEMDLKSAYRHGASVMTNNLLLEDGQEGLRSFVEKRPPVWRNDFKSSDKK